MTVLVTSSDVYKEQYGYIGSPFIWVLWDFMGNPNQKLLEMVNHCIYIRPLAIIFLLSSLDDRL